MVTKTSYPKSEIKSNWQPKWTVKTSGGSEVGVTIDDHCSVVLSAGDGGQWHSIKHIPREVAQLIGQLISEGQTNCRVVSR